MKRHRSDEMSSQPGGLPQANGRSLPKGNAAAAWTLLLGLLLIYHLNGDFQYVRDAEGSVFLPVSLLNEGNLSFTPSEMPFMFTWQLQTATGTSRRTIPRWQERDGTTPLWSAYREGRLKVASPNYNILPSTRVDASTGERQYVNAYGIGAGLTALPAFALLHVAVGDLRDHPQLLWYTAKSVASLLVALSAVWIYLASRRFLDTGLAALVAVSYGLGTCVWSTSSQTLWQHAPNEFFLALGSYFLLLTGSHDSKRYSAYCGVAFGCAVICRPTSAIVAATVAIYLIATNPRLVPAYVLAALPIALAASGYNAYYLGSALMFGQTEIGAPMAVQKTGHPGVWQTPLWQGILGLLLSPSRGLLVFSPFLAFALPGLWLAWRDQRFAVLRPLAATLVIVLIVESKWFDWWGGWSYGYRRIVDVTVFLALLLMPIMEWIAARRWRLAAFLGLLGWSVAVQFVGAFAYDGYGWNARLAGYYVRLPGQSQTTLVDDEQHAKLLVATRGAVVVGERRLDVDKPEHRHRLWSLRDNQIMYYFSHFHESRRAKLAAIAGVGE